MKASFVTLLALALLAQCHHKDPDPQKPEDQLPPATQTGANTIGFLLNGQPWTPRGYNGYSNYAISYDTGVMNLTSYRYPVSGSNDFQSLKFFVRELQEPAVFNFQSLPNVHLGWDDSALGCDINSGETGTYCRGSLTITRLDKAKGIISGTFDFTLAKPGCDTVRVTQGRFDKQL